MDWSQCCRWCSGRWSFGKGVVGTGVEVVMSRYIRSFVVRTDGVVRDRVNGYDGTGVV